MQRTATSAWPNSSSPGGMTEDYPYSYTVEPYRWTGTIILVDDNPILPHDTLIHLMGTAYFSEGGYVTGATGPRFNICKVFGDPGTTRL